MRKASLPLTLVAIAAALPVLVPVAIVLHTRDQRRMQAPARKAQCENCGVVLGQDALILADAAWAAHVAKLGRDHPGVRFRLVRRLRAVCTACAAEYDFDPAARVFVRLY